MTRRPLSTLAARCGVVRVPVLALALVLGTACSSDDSPAAGADVTANDPSEATGAPPGSPDATPDPAPDPSGTPGEPSDLADGDGTSPPGTASDPALDTAPDTLPEVGVPGLDSELVVCRAWSRFAGSFQVTAVAASFGDDPLDAARLEVVSAPVVVDAAAEMIDNWPEELVDEADAVADGLLGPYARRAAGALAALVAAGADDVDVEAIADAWIDALSVRDATEVVPVVVLPAGLDAIVDAAAAAFDAAVVPIPADPSLVTDVDVPRSEEFLFETCPDRGTLAGTEIAP